MWFKHVTRRLAVQVAQDWNFGLGEAMRKVYGICVKDTLVFRDAKKTEYYVDERQHRAYLAGLNRLLKDDDFIKNFHKQAQVKLEKILQDVKSGLKIDLSKLSNRKLLKIYTGLVLPNAAQFYIRMWTVFNVGDPLANVVADNLKEYVPAGESTEYLLKLSSPLVPNDVLKERGDALKLALLKGRVSESVFSDKLDEHTRKYCHIPMFDFDHKPYDRQYFLREIKSIKNPQRELDELKTLFANRRKEFTEILKGLKPDKKFRNLLEFLKENVFLRDYRDMIRQKLNLELRKFYKEVGSRLGLGVEEAAVLTNDEITKYLNIGERFPQKEIEQRKRAYLLIQRGSTAEIYSGARALAKAKKELNVTNLKAVREIKGVVGAAGKAKGIVKIVFTNKDLPKVKRGDVMVATMTRQDFVPAIRLAAALITDEGAVTCHAAIIARELGKPCIVATKIATKVLKDGDRVEVDAIKGVVKKI